MKRFRPKSHVFLKKLTKINIKYNYSIQKKEKIDKRIVNANKT